MCLLIADLIQGYTSAKICLDDKAILHNTIKPLYDAEKSLSVFSIWLMKVQVWKHGQPQHVCFAYVHTIVHIRVEKAAIRLSIYILHFASQSFSTVSNSKAISY